MVTFKLIYTLDFGCETAENDVNKNLLIRSIDEVINNVVSVICEQFTCNGEKVAVKISKRIK